MLYRARWKYLLTINNAASEHYFPAELFLMAPLLALSTSVVLGFSAGLIFSVVLVLVAGSVSAARSFIARPVRIPLLLLIMATWISLFDMLLSAWFYDLRQQLGIYLPLLAINSLVFATAEEHYLTQPLRKSVPHALRIGGMVMVLFLAAAGVREFLAYGSLMGDAGLIFGGAGVHIKPHATIPGLVLAGKAPGAFICLGLVFAAWNYSIDKMRAVPATSKPGRADGIE